MIEFDDMEPWEQYEHLKRRDRGEIPAVPGGQEPVPVSGERVLTFWHQLVTGTFTGKGYGASPVTLTRLFKIFSEADLLLARLFGLGAVRTGFWFDPELALEHAEAVERAQGSDAVIETLRQVARPWLDEGISVRTPLTPHFLYAAMLYWCQGQEFSWAIYEQMLPRIMRVSAEDLFLRLHLAGDPARQAQVQGTINALGSLPVKVTAPVFVRFESPAIGLRSQDYGPYTWIEIVHDELKVAPTGRHLATLSRADDTEYWVIFDPQIPARQVYTNVIIGPAEVPDGWVQPDDTPESRAPDAPAPDPSRGPGA